MTIKDKLDLIHQRIQNALIRAGRQSENITLIGVTKQVDTTVIQEAVSNGLVELGENRVQELLSKYDQVIGANWHMIGRLQRNKVKYIVDKATMIHSLDRLSLAREINRQAEKIQRVMPVLVQVNIANEESKAGLPYEEVVPFVESLFNLRYIRVMGLMQIAPFMDDQELIRPYFTRMKRLFDDLRQYNYPHTDIRYLSMGMTNDFETAIEEGANMIRIGTAIFGDRKKEEN